MKVPLRWNDEYVIWRYIQAFGDQVDGHRGITRQNFVELGCDDPEVIDDYNRDIQIGRQMLKQASIRIKTAS